MLPNEQVQLEIQRSPVAYFRSVVELLITLYVAWLARSAASARPFWDDWKSVQTYRGFVEDYLWDDFGIPTSWIAGLIGLLALLLAWSALSRLLRELSCGYQLTNVRLQARYGLLGRRSDEVLLRAVAGVSVQQSPLGRLLGYATLEVGGRGQAPLQLRHVSEPDMVKQMIERSLFKRKTASEERPAGS